MSQFPGFGGFQAVPGVTAAYETIENNFIDMSYSHVMEIPVIIAGSARDAGNTGYTSTLRPGLALGGPIEALEMASPYAANTDAYKVKEWDPTDVDGTNFFFGFLKYGVKVLDPNGSNVDKYSVAVVEGAVLSDRIFIGGNVASGISGTYAEEFLQQAMPRFLFDKHVNKRYSAKAVLPFLALPDAAITLATTYFNRTFDNRNATASRTVTLPAPVPGQFVRFHRTVAQAIVIDPGTPTIIAPGNLAVATSAALASDGAFLELTGYSTTQWIVTASLGTITYT